MRNTTTTKAFAVLAATLALGACEITSPLENVDLKLDIVDAPVVLEGSSGTVAVAAGAGASTATMVNMSSDVEEISNLKKVSFKPSYFSFTPAAGSGSGSSTAGIVAANGSVSIVIAVAGYPIPGMPVTVEVANGAVTGVTPESIDLENPSYDKAAIEAVYASIDAASRPALPPDWGSLTAQAALDRITNAISSKSFDVRILVYSETLTGQLQVKQFSMDGRVSSSIGD